MTSKNEDVDAYLAPTGHVKRHENTHRQSSLTFRERPIILLLYYSLGISQQVATGDSGGSCGSS